MLFAVQIWRPRFQKRLFRNSMARTLDDTTEEEEVVQAEADPITEQPETDITDASAVP